MQLRKIKKRQALLVKVWTMDGVMYNENGVTKEQEREGIIDYLSLGIFVQICLWPSRSRW
jgi:hypothetical protein